MRKFIRIFLVLLTTLLTLTGISAKAEEDVYYTGYTSDISLNSSYINPDPGPYAIDEGGESKLAYCFNRNKSRPPANQNLKMERLNTER